MAVGAYRHNYDEAGANYLMFSGSAHVFTRAAGVWSQQQTLVGLGTNGRVASDTFGTSVSLNGETLVVGAPGQDYDAAGANSVSSAGAAYVFTRTTGTWGLQQKLVGSGTNSRTASDGFGNAVSLSGETVVVASNMQDYDESGANSINNAGAAFVFTRATGTWGLQQKLIGVGASGRVDSDSFANSVALDSNTVISGVPYQDYDASGAYSMASSGASFAFTRTSGVWSAQQKLVVPGVNSRVSGDNFGRVVAVDSSTAVVGAPYHAYDANSVNGVTTAGAAYIFTRPSSGVWGLQQKLVASGTNGRNSSDNFGSAVAVSGETVLLGASGQDYDADGANSVDAAGAAYVFTRASGVWALQQKLVGSGTNGRVASDSFGIGVSVSGDTLAIGASGQDYDEAGANLVSGAGAVYVFTRASNVWGLQQKIVPTGTNARVAGDAIGGLGAISLGADTLVVGTYAQDYDASGANPVGNAGAAYVFTRASGTWAQQQKLVATGTNSRQANDYFGVSAAISGETVVIGARLQSYDEAGANSLSGAGAAYVFTRASGTWGLQQKLVGSGTNGRVASDFFGYSVAINSDRAIVGAYGQDYDATGANSVDAAGAAYVFTRASGTWTLEQKIAGAGTNGRVASDNFGYSVGVCGDNLVGGAYANSYDLSGATSLSGAGAVWLSY